MILYVKATKREINMATFVAVIIMAIIALVLNVLELIIDGHFNVL